MATSSVSNSSNLSSTTAPMASKRRGDGTFAVAKAQARSLISEGCAARRDGLAAEAIRAQNVDQ
eukprot:CAMPEP_0115884776 /NCGR_PEP_ID=MMETSP0287-20121206/30308_1 /TAXON_ID=412157 /ORGANISM="Chrysochromulina rotalis, Strain UIO044" /LENGTH=63 /DNA_ID=CAMNT_0003341123 /DNA_START=22 /DNA_END=210 /DNA_ORIENTATION=-